MNKSIINKIDLTYQQNQDGAVMVLVAIFLIVFLSFTALVLDGMRMSTFRQEAQNHAGLAAMAALEEFVASPAGSKISRAIERANSVSGFNLAFTEHSESVSSSSESGPNITFGMWYFKNPEFGSPCTGGGSSSPNPPCFVPVANSEEINAVQITGNFYKELKLPFGGVAFAQPTITIPVHVTASVIPMQGIALFDLSRSMVKETHDTMKDSAGTKIVRSDGKEARHRYGYFLSGPNGLGGPTNQDKDWEQLLANFPTRGGDTDPTKHYVSDYQNPNASYRDVQILSDANFSSDYSGHHPSPAAHPEFSAAQGVYRMDQYGAAVSATGDYVGPEPYTTMLIALRETVKRLKERRTAGSKFGIIFYDQKMSWTRTFNLTDDFDYLLAFLEPTDPNSAMLRYSHDIFPNEQANTNTPLALREAARQLYDTSEAAIPSSKFVMLLGDGMTNCAGSCPGVYYPQLDTNGDGAIDDSEINNFNLCNGVSGSYTFQTQCIDSPASYPSVQNLCSAIRALGPAEACKFSDLDHDGYIGLTGSRYDYEDTQLMQELDKDKRRCAAGINTCQDTYPSYEMSMDAVKRIARDSFAPSKTPIHIFIAGKTVMPLTQDIEDPKNPGTCLSQKEIRVLEGKRPDIYSGTFPPYHDVLTLTGQRFMAPELGGCWYTTYGLDCAGGYYGQYEDLPLLKVQIDLYKVAQMTGGEWAPLRPYKPNCTIRGCQPCAECLIPWSTVPLSKLATMDPKCEDTPHQVDRYLDEIFSVNPYGLVMETPE